ncbi:ABC transporter permease [Fischerella thermalis CCMEE 5273]|uniref:ABC transporter n=1 Tax=Chlorogloeopsis fritschii PCC 6912 TaxID=211165 RepID=A0A433NLV2_CHLFR|nr:ABC transporter permease DevC [Chlorogloeopsis fritschii]PMB03916.1 ABC transporter permease [Fischerella thermalis CCMEE 5273]PMB49142.1 ABC transporter permease [Fischerella thermalis CCMEE 5205]RUR83887.1 ABC transporter [Chlorogloeopsis fritschii PCC 6912]
MSKIPLAWLQLTREKSRMIVAMAGIAFSNILMFMQLGFEGALYDSAARFHTTLKADLVMISPRSKSLAYMRQFSSRRLYQISGFEGVNSVSPVYVDFADWKNPVNADYRAIFVFGFEPEKPVFNLPEVNQNLNKLKLPDTVLFDRSSRSEYGPIAAQFERDNQVLTEISNYRIKTVGLFTLGPSFAADGNLITSDQNFLRLFRNRRSGEIDIGLITLKPGVDKQKVLNNLVAKLPKDVRILTYQGFIEFEKEYWRTSTPIGFMFALGTGMGFIVGIVIVYQILFTDVNEHLAEYATLKAMGFTDNYLLRVVFQEALILAIFGYIPGLGISLGLYELTKFATFLPIFMSASRSVFVLVLTILMCSISGAIAVRKLRAADPADIF